MTDDITYVVLTAQAWGKASHELDAIRELAPHTSGTDDLDATIVKCRGYEETTIYEVFADEILDEHEVTLDGERLARLREIEQDAELLAEEIAVDAHQ